MVSIDDVSVSSKDAMTSDLSWSGEVCAVRSLFGECGVDRVGLGFGVCMWVNVCYE